MSEDHHTTRAPPQQPPKKSISRDRAILAYIMAIIIPGVGHMVVGRIARGFLIMIAGFFIGLVSAMIWGLSFFD